MTRVNVRRSDRRNRRPVLALLLGTLLVAGCSSAGASPSTATGTAAPTGAASGAPSSDGSSGSPTLDRIRAEGKIKVAFSNEAPFSFDDNGKLTGSAPELMREILKAEGVATLEPSLTEFAALIPALQSGRVDVIGSPIFITPVRCESILFADPEYQTGEAFVVKKGNPKNLRSFADIAANKDAKVAVLLGSAEVDYAKIAGIADAQQVIIPDYPTGISSLQAGQVDAVIQLTISLRDLFKRTNDPNLEFVYLTEQPKNAEGKSITSYGGIGFRKEDAALRDLYSAGLKKLRASGKMLEIMKGFDFAEEDLPPADLTSDEVCAS